MAQAKVYAESSSPRLQSQCLTFVQKHLGIQLQPCLEYQGLRI